MSLRRLSLGIGSTLFDKIIVAVIQLLLVPLLSNAWGLSLYGTWAMMTTIPSMLALSDFGIVSSAWARMTMFMSRGQPVQARAALHTAWLTASLICVLAIAISIAVLALLPAEQTGGANQLSGAEFKAAALALVLYGLGVIMTRLNTIVFRAAGNYTLAVWCSTTFFTLENLALVAAVLSGAGLVIAAATLLAARAVCIVGVFLLAKLRYREVSPGFSHASWSEWREMWRPALSSSLLGFGSLAFLQVSVLVLGFIAGSAAVPAFVAVRTLSRIGLQIAMMVANPAAQEFAQKMSIEQHFRAGRYFGLVAATALVMGLGMAVGLALLGMRFIDFWTGGAITASFPLILFMALSSAGAVMWNALSSLISALNRQGAIAHLSVLISTIGIGVILVLAGRIGTNAAGLAYAVTDIGTAIALLLFVRRTWWRDAEFRRGAWAAVAQLRTPLSTLRAIRHDRIDRLEER